MKHGNSQQKQTAAPAAGIPVCSWAAAAGRGGDEVTWIRVGSRKVHARGARPRRTAPERGVEP